MSTWDDPRPDAVDRVAIRQRLRSLAELVGVDVSTLEAAIAAIEAELPSFAYLVNTDGDDGRTIYIGSIDPDGVYPLEIGDVWGSY